LLRACAHPRSKEIPTRIAVAVGQLPEPSGAISELRDRSRDAQTYTHLIATAHDVSERSTVLLMISNKFRAALRARGNKKFPEWSILRFAWSAVGGAPLFIERADGAYLFEADGNRFIDYVGFPMRAGLESCLFE